MNLKVDIYAVCRDFNFGGEDWSILLINITSIGGSCDFSDIYKYNKIYNIIGRLFDPNR